MLETIIKNLKTPLLVCLWDEFLGEYVPKSRNRLYALTRFTGSNGIAFLDPNGSRKFFTDGRYTIQARQEVSGFEICDIKDLRAFLESYEEKIAVNTFCIPFEFGKNLRDRLVHDDQIDALLDIPKPEVKRVFEYDVKYSGRSREDKIQSIREYMKEKSFSCYFVTDPVEVNYLLNIRGEDVEFTPLANIFALISDEDVILVYTNVLKNETNIRVVLKDEAFEACQGKDVMHSKSISKGMHALLSSHAKNTQADRFIAHQMSVKNDTEIDFAHQIHYHDGVALNAFMREIKANYEKYDEYTAAKKLLEIRQENAKVANSSSVNFVSPSFATISGMNENGAIIHYNPSENSKNCKKLENGVYLVDSGGQYWGCTTDVTRTLWLGSKTPPNALKTHYTLVLKGHISLATAIFKKGTTGAELDILARQHLWNHGLDYAHGTGHGVGSFLSVHEGSYSISKGGNIPLQTGMIISNEPGFYLEGEYGIRIENLVLVKERSDNPSDGSSDFLEFETLTRAQIDETLINWDIMSPLETQWIKWYNEYSLI